MFTSDGLLQLHTWTNYSLDRLFGHCAQFTDEELTREFEGFGFSRLLAQLAHIVLCEQFWVCMLSGQPPVTELPERPTFAWLEEVRPRILARTRDYLSRMDDATLNTEATLHFEDGFKETATPAYYMNHVLTHCFHHKGQAAAMCRLLGKPFAQDMDLLYKAEWPEAKEG